MLHRKRATNTSLSSTEANIEVHTKRRILSLSFDHSSHTTTPPRRFQDSDCSLATTSATLIWTLSVVFRTTHWNTAHLRAGPLAFWTLLFPTCTTAFDRKFHQGNLWLGGLGSWPPALDALTCYSDWRRKRMAIASLNRRALECSCVVRISLTCFRSPFDRLCSILNRSKARRLSA